MRSLFFQPYDSSCLPSLEKISPSIAGHFSVSSSRRTLKVLPSHKEIPHPPRAITLPSGERARHEAEQSAVNSANCRGSRKSQTLPEWPKDANRRESGKKRMPLG